MVLVQLSRDAVFHDEHTHQRRVFFFLWRHGIRPDFYSPGSFQQFGAFTGLI